jgi:hypothetical protein
VHSSLPNIDTLLWYPQNDQLRRPAPIERRYTQFCTATKTQSPVGDEDFASPAGSSCPCAPTKKTRAPLRRDNEHGRGPSTISSAATAALPSTPTVFRIFLTRSFQQSARLLSGYKAVSPARIFALIIPRYIRDIDSASASIYSVTHDSRCLNRLFKKLVPQ